MHTYQPTLSPTQSHSISSPTAYQYASNVHASSAATSVAVWTNVKTGIFHHQKWRWDSNTKVGLYLSEKVAIASGFRAARNGQ